MSADKKDAWRLLAWFVGGFGLICAVAFFSGCEDRTGGFEADGEPELAAIARRVMPELEAAFGVQVRGRYTLCYAEESRLASYQILVSRTAGSSTVEHVRHELMHIVQPYCRCDVGGGTRMHPEFANGVRVRSVVASWGNYGKGDG